MTPSEVASSEPGRAAFSTSLLLFLGLRLTLLLALPLEALTQYGDFQHYFQLAAWAIPGQCPSGAAACLPLIDYWREFPPVFPYLSILLVRLTGGGGVPPFHVFAYALAFVLLAADLGSLVLVRHIALRVQPATADWLTLIYAVLPVTIPLSWWAFDGLTTLWMLLGLWALLARRDGLSALAIGLGILTKLVPGLLVLVVWRARPIRRAAAISLCVAGLVGVGLAPFFWRAPAMTAASLWSQVAKSSYATVWAMVDGNLQTAEGAPVTGNFGGLAERFNADQAAVPLHQPARLPWWTSLTVAGLIYAAVWRQTRRQRGAWTDQQTVHWLALAWVIFALWSKGWSPQWLQMLAPLILLTLPSRTSLLFTLVLGAVCFLEWPLLLSRGLVWGYWITISLRTGLLAAWGVALVRGLLSTREAAPSAPVAG